MKNQTALKQEHLSSEEFKVWLLYRAASAEKQRQVRIMLGLEKAPTPQWENRLTEGEDNAINP